ncbi:MAG: arginine--tRNA ligase, partial [Alphaproteobacteria bacterium]|nr:arginine--tRNA ligase [Alphaproteobacteria bacterium]
TMNAKDGKPFKTRAGGVLRLEDMIHILKDAAEKRLKETNENLARQIGVSALKFGDLMNPPPSDYVLVLDSFTQFEGKTGPYIQYTAVRIQSILSKTSFETGAVIFSHESERSLVKELLSFHESFYQAYQQLNPSLICQKAFEIAQAFNSFYHACPILKENDMRLQKSRIILSQTTLKVFKIFADLIGIEIPEKM